MHERQEANCNPMHALILSLGTSGRRQTLVKSPRKSSTKSSAREVHVESVEQQRRSNGQGQVLA